MGLRCYNLMTTMRIAPSMLAADAAALGDEAQRMEAAGADMLHLDIMDGCFVPNLTFGPHVVAALRKRTSLPLDVHLMVRSPGALVPAFADAGATYLGVHAEADPHLHRLISQIRRAGCKPALALNPATHESVVQYLMDELDLILCMSVNPGFGGQAFLPLVLPKIAAVRRMIVQSGREVLLQVDGGVADGTLPALLAAGADTFVAGTALLTAPDPAAVMAAWRALAAPQAGREK